MMRRWRPSPPGSPDGPAPNSPPMPNHRRYLIRLWSVRAVAALAVIGIIATTVLDFTTSFWEEHPMLTAYVSGLLLIALGSALVNEWLSARSRRRWQEIAALALIQWRDRLTGVIEAMPARAALADRDERSQLAARLGAQLDDAYQVAVTWAPLVVGDGTYVFALDSYVHLIHRTWRVVWVLNRDSADQMSPSPLADEVAGLERDARLLRGRLDTMIGELLPWPAHFGPRPGATTG